MNNMTFPEMNSATSSAHSDILETINTNLNIFNTQLPQVTIVDTPRPPMTMQLPRPQPTQAPRPPVAQQQQRPQPSQPQQPAKTVSFNNNVQQKTISPLAKKTTLPVATTTTTTPTTPVVAQQPSTPHEASISITEAAIKLAENEAIVGATASHIINLGSFKMPKKTLLLIGGVVLISVGLFFATKPRVHKKKDKKVEEDEE